MRLVEEQPLNGCNIYYNYVPFALERAFEDIDYQTFKELHRQVIHLAIHLAKNYILTSFHPARCGVLFLDGHFILKYYLPLHEIVITENISMLERSVQLFKVQATHVLDTLCHVDNSEFHSLPSDSFTLKPSAHLSAHKHSSLEQYTRTRKLSNQPSKPLRRLSNAKSLKSLISDARRKRSDSTNYSEVKITGLKQTLKSLKENSERKRNWEREKMEIRTRIEFLRLRSREALKTFDAYKQSTRSYFELLRIVTSGQTTRRPT